MLLRYAQHRVGLDAAIFDQAIANYARLRAPDVLLKSVEPFNILGDHFSPALALFAPVFRLFPSVLTLLVGQAVLFAVAVAIVGGTARRLALPAWLAAGLTWAYGLSIGMVEAINYDFHEVALTVPVLAGSLSLLLTGRIAAGSLLLAATMLIREDNAALLVGVGLVLLTLRHRRAGPALIIGGAVMFGLLVAVIIPAFNSYGYYTYLSASSAAGGNGSMLGSVLVALRQSLSIGQGPKTAVLLLLPFLFLPLRSRWIIPAALLLTIRLVSNNPAYWGLALPLQLHSEHPARLRRHRRRQDSVRLRPGRAHR